MKKKEKERRLVQPSDDTKILSLYLLYNDCEGVKTRTYIGCVEDVFARLLQHNGITGGSPRQTRKAQGHWKLLCILLIPPVVRAKVSAKEIKKRWRLKSRGVERRIKQGVELSRQYDLYCFLSESVVKSDSKELKDVVRQYEQQEQTRKILTSIMSSQCKV